MPSAAPRHTLTRRRRLASLAAALVVLVGFADSRPVAGATLSETGAGTFTAPDQRFVFSGTVTGTPITGTITGTQTIASNQDPQTGCFGSTVDVTLADAAGNTLTKFEKGTLCPVISEAPTDPDMPPRVRRFTGTFTITGGTGIYAGATGSGTSTIDFNFGPTLRPTTFTFTSTETGTFDLPGVPTTTTTTVASTTTTTMASTTTTTVVPTTTASTTTTLATTTTAAPTTTSGASTTTAVRGTTTDVGVTTTQPATTSGPGTVGTTAPTGGGSNLPATGSDNAGVIYTAALFVGLGCALLVLGRRSLRS